MYSNKVVLALKSQGKVLRELGAEVFLPFGTEYSIFVKNLSSVRVAVKVWVDGIEATESVQLLIDPSSEVELERFIKNGNLQVGNRFKFIERNQHVEKFRGVGVEDGLVRIEYQFEQVQNINIFNSNPRRIIKSHFGNPPSPFGQLSGQTWTPTASTAAPGYLGHHTTYDSYQPESKGAVSHQASGVTAPGSVSHQQFNAVSGVQLDPQKHTMILQLRGEHVGKTVTSAVTVQTRTSCVTCGLLSVPSPNVMFCSRCGTSLQII